MTFKMISSSLFLDDQSNGPKSLLGYSLSALVVNYTFVPVVNSLPKAVSAYIILAQ